MRPCGLLPVLFLVSGCGGGCPGTAVPTRGAVVEAPGSEAEPGVRFVGRFDATDTNAVRLSWSGSGFVVRFRGTGARAVLRGGGFFTVVVDGAVGSEPLAVSGRDETYALATGLPNGVHTVEVYRRTEGSLGPTVVGRVEVDGALLSAPRPSYQVEIVGDSWSTGDGVDGPSGRCELSPEMQNHFLTWGAIATRAVGAELSTVASGGRGIVVKPMADLYDRVIATSSISTGTLRPADVVLVSLGANDFVEGLLPATFVPEYASLLKRIRARHPGALIGCVRPRLRDPAETERIHTAVEAAVALRAAAGDARVLAIDIEREALADVVCDDYHPGVRSHAAMGQYAIEFLAAAQTSARSRFGQ